MGISNPEQPLKYFKTEYTIELLWYNIPYVLCLLLIPLLYVIAVASTMIHYVNHDEKERETGVIIVSVWITIIFAGVCYMVIEHYLYLHQITVDKSRLALGIGVFIGVLLFGLGSAILFFINHDTAGNQTIALILLGIALGIAVVTVVLVLYRLWVVYSNTVSNDTVSIYDPDAEEIEVDTALLRM